MRKQRNDVLLFLGEKNDVLLSSCFLFPFGLKKGSYWFSCKGASEQGLVSSPFQKGRLENKADD
jgi:hypothetical protein